MIRVSYVISLAAVVAWGAISANPVGAAEKEQLLVPVLNGWTRISDFNDPVGENSEWIPVGQKEADWTRKITIQAFRGSPLTATEFLTLALDRSADVCDGVSSSQIQSLNTNGQEIGERVIYCYRYKGDDLGHATLYWVLRGQQALYVTSMTWRTAPFNAQSLPLSEQELREAQTLTRGITLGTNNSLK